MSSIIQDKEEVEELIKAFVAFAPKEWKLNEDNLVYNIDSSRDGNSAMSFNGLNFKVNEDLQAKGAYNQAKVKEGGHPTAIYLIFDSDVNKAGVGDGLKPDVARTYNISFEIQGKRYRQRSNLPSHLFKIYVYSRTIEGVIQRFSDKLAPILDYIQIQGIEIDGADKNDWEKLEKGGAVKEYKFGDKFKLDSVRVDQYEGYRVVDIVEVVEDGVTGKNDKRVLVYIPYLQASYLVYKSDLKPLEILDYDGKVIPKWLALNGGQYEGDAVFVNGYNGDTSTEDDGVLCALVDNSAFTDGRCNYLLNRYGFKIRSKNRRGQTIKIEEGDDVEENYKNGGAVEDLFSEKDIFISEEKTEKGESLFGGWVGSEDNAKIIIPFSYESKAEAMKRGQKIVDDLNSGSYKSGIPIFGDGGTIKQPVAKDTFLYASTGVKVKVLDYDSRFGGRVLVKRADGYETGGRPMWQPLKKFSEAPPSLEDGGIVYPAYGGQFADFEGGTKQELDAEIERLRAIKEMEELTKHEEEELLAEIGLLEQLYVDAPFSIYGSGGEWYIKDVKNHHTLPSSTTLHWIESMNKFKTKVDAVQALQTMVDKMNEENPAYNLRWRVEKDGTLFPKYEKGGVILDIDSLHPLDLWVKFPDNRYYRKFQFPKSDMVSGKYREIVDNGVSERMEDNGDYWDVTISVASESEADRISAIFVKEFPVGMKMEDGGSLDGKKYVIKTKADLLTKMEYIREVDENTVEKLPYSQKYFATKYDSYEDAKKALAIVKKQFGSEDFFLQPVPHKFASYEDRCKLDSLKIAQAYRDFLKDELSYEEYAKIVSETKIPYFKLTKIETEVSKNSDFRPIDIYQFWSVESFADGGSIKSDFVKINHRGRNLTVETLEYEKGNPNKNGNLKLTLTPEGREVLVEASSEGKLDAEIMWELFESIQVNSELMYFDDAGEVGLGMTSAPAITDGYYYDDDGKLTDKGHPDAQVFWYPDYMVRSFMDDLLENGYAIFVRADSYEKGGTVGNATLWKVGNGSAVKLISGTKRQIKTFLTKNRFKGMAYENHQGEYSLQEWDSEVTEEQVLKHNKSNQLSATSQEYGRGGKVSGFNLTYGAWGEDSTVDKNGKLIVGTIRTIPENYYVATVYSNGTVSNDGIEANTRHISSSEIQEWYSENVPKLNKAELLAAINKRLARQYEGSALQAQLSNISEKLSKGIFENGGALANSKSFFWWW